MPRKSAPAESASRARVKGRPADLLPKEAAFVEARLTVAHSDLQAARIAGYADPKAIASTVAARPIVAAAIEDRRSAAMKAAGIELATVYKNLAFAGADREPEARSSAVRANEILLKAAGELAPDVRVTVDARSAILPTVDVGAAAAVFARMFESVVDVPRETGPTDGGPVGGGGP